MVERLVYVYDYVYDYVYERRSMEISVGTQAPVSSRSAD